MKKVLRSVHNKNPSKNIGIIANDLILMNSPDEFVHDFLEVPFEKGRAYKYNCFKFILANPEQFAGQVGRIETGDYSDKHIWHVFRQVATELEREIKAHAQ